METAYSRNAKNIEEWSDGDLEEEVSRIQTIIEDWAISKDLWHDSGFKSYLEHIGGEPKSLPCVTLLCSDGPLIHELDYGLDEEFRVLLDKQGYFFEIIDAVTIAIYPDTEVLSDKFEKYFHWKWICGLIQEDTADVYEDMYSHFTRMPEDLYRLDWRDFEILLFRIFQNHGYRAILGPGKGDDGVDIRLWQEDPLGDVLTLVQAKRYAADRAIDLTHVAALHGIRDVEKADKALFVTTSKYAPVAKRFAARTSGLLELAAKEEIVSWCEKATNGVIKNKSSLLTLDNITAIIEQTAKRRDYRVVHASWGYSMTINVFALVVKESKHAALLMGLNNRIHEHDGYEQVGTDIPVLDPFMANELLNPENVWRARREEKDGRVHYWDGERLFSPWNGKPMYFNFLD